MTALSRLRPAPVRILDCAVHPVTMQEALDWCLDTCRSAPRARIVLTANASHLVELQDHPGLRSAAAAADLVTADGMSLVWASRFLGAPLPERVTGIDMLSNLLRLAPQHGLRIFLLGTKPEVLARFVAFCRETYPGIQLAGWRDGYFSAAEHDAVIQQIADSRADILFVAMPSPFKDIWCEQHRDRFRVRLIMGVGGAFDVLAGMVPRAPGWMQDNGLEWAWRLLLEPRRLWRRYLTGNSRFIYLLLRDKFRSRVPAVQS